MFKTNPGELENRLEQQMNEMKDLRHELEKFKEQASLGEARSFLASAKTVGELKVITAQRDGMDAAAMRKQGDFLRDKEPKVVAVLASCVVFALPGIRDVAANPLVRILLHLVLLPIVVAITYEINRWCGRNDNAFTRALSAPGMWMQHFTTNEPDDSMIEVGIAAVQAVLPEKEGSDRW